jgi:recombination protein RecA
MTETTAGRYSKRYAHLSIEALRRGDELLERPGSADLLEELFGRLTELVGKDASAGLTAAMGLVRDAQRKKEPALWIADRDSTFFPPDATDLGVDLDCLPVVRAPVESMVSAADKIIRSGGFGLVVADLTSPSAAPRWARNDAALSRLLGSAQKHDAAVVFLTREASNTSLGSLISLRAEAARSRSVSGSLEVTVITIKDKRRPPGRRLVSELCHGPAGMH